MSSCAPPRVTRSAATQLHHGLVLLLVLGPILRAVSCSWSRIPTTTRPRALNARTLNSQRCAIQTMDPPLVAVAICAFMAAAIQAHPTQTFPPFTRTRWDEATPHSLALKPSRPRTTRCGLSRMVHLLPLRCPPPRLPSPNPKRRGQVIPFSTRKSSL